MKTAVFVLMTLLFAGCAAEEPELLASPYNSTLKCWEQRQTTGKFAQQEECNQAIAIVMDEQGQVWKLRNSCGKKEFKALSQQNTQWNEFHEAKMCEEINL